MNPQYIFSGKVIKGHSRGKNLGFPTANIEIEQEIPEGIYLSLVIFDERSYKALTFIGTAKTYNENSYKSETFIFDFSEDIYNQSLKVSLLRKIRDNMKFDSEQELVKQMEDDKIKALRFFSEYEDNKQRI